ncbi:MAG: glycosyl transferase [Oleiphilus sp.]|nr:MAG: glycosyl transferase [Oleiphilus sp.]
MSKKHLCILQVLPALASGGVERGTVDISHALTQSGHVSICVSSGGRLVSDLEAHGARHIHLPVHSKNPFRILLNGFRLARIIRQHHVSLMHVRSRAPAWSCLLARKLTGVPLVSTFHGQYGSQHRLKRYYNSAMLRTDQCIAVSDFIAQHIRQTYPRYSEQLTTIYRGVDMEYFSPDAVSAERKASLLAALGLSETEVNDNKLILLPGRMSRLKGHATFLRALHKLQASRPFIALVMGNDQHRSQYVQELQRLTKQLQLTTKVRFAGACDDMPAAYALSDIVVSASTKPESFGRAGCEAQAMQKLLVVTNHGGSAETVADCQKQGLCAPGSAEDMARALATQMALDDQRAIATGTASRQHIAEHYSLEQMCQKTLAMYTTVLAKHKAKQLKFSHL